MSRSLFSRRALSISARIKPLACFAVFSGALLAFPLLSQAQVTVVTSGVDTTLPSGTGLNGADTPHGGAGQNPDGVEGWEWDGSDGGGENQGLIWFDIPPSALANDVLSATLSLHVHNEGDSGNGHRITSDWLSGPDGGDNVTYNNMAGGPGIVLGGNAVADVSFSTGFLDADTVAEFDVTADVQAWVDGAPNYGWGVLPTDTNGVGITSFESGVNPVPTLTIVSVPEPSTIAMTMIALLGIALGAARRKFAV